MVVRAARLRELIRSFAPAIVHTNLDLSDLIAGLAAPRGPAPGHTSRPRKRSPKRLRRQIDFEKRSQETKAPPKFVQAGRLYPQKAHETSIRPFRRLVSERGRCRLLLVDEGPTDTTFVRLQQTLASPIA